MLCCAVLCSVNAKSVSVLQQSVPSAARLSARPQPRSAVQPEPRQQLSVPKLSQWCLAPQQEAQAWAAAQEVAVWDLLVPRGALLGAGLVPGGVSTSGMQLPGRVLIVQGVMQTVRLQQDWTPVMLAQQQLLQEHPLRSGLTHGPSSRCSSSKPQVQLQAREAGARWQHRRQQQLQLASLGRHHLLTPPPQQQLLLLLLRRVCLSLWL